MAKSLFTLIEKHFHNLGIVSVVILCQITRAVSKATLTSQVIKTLMLQDPHEKSLSEINGQNNSSAIPGSCCEAHKNVKCTYSFVHFQSCHDEYKKRKLRLTSHLHRRRHFSGLSLEKTVNGERNFATNRKILSKLFDLFLVRTSLNCHQIFVEYVK